MVVTDISLMGWLFSTTEPSGRVVLGVIAVAFLTLGIMALHRQIGRRIDQAGTL